MSSYWQQAWDEAEPRLRAWKASRQSASPRPTVLRVNQLDAELLDEELVQTLQEPLTKALSIINPAFRTKLEPELALIIRLTLYKFSVWDFGETYGAKLQDLRYFRQNTTGQALSPSGLPQRILAIHIFLTVLVPYFYSRLKSHALSNAWPDTPSSDRRRKAWNLLTRLESLYSTSGLLSFVVFLWNGRYRNLADRLLSMRLVPSRRLTNHQVSYEFMNRQMVWHAFTEFLLLLLPALSSRAFRRSYNQLNLRLRNFRWSSILPSTSPLSSEKTVVQRGHFSSLPSDQCAICAEDSSFNISSPADASETLSTYLNSVAYASVADGSLKRDDIDSSPVVSEVDEPPPHPITTPYAASCGHIYCYVCLSGRLIRALDDGDEGWVCLRCAEIVRSSERVHALCEDDSTRTSEGLASDVDELASFESDMSFDSESEQPCD